jgi:hypothetical protein
MEIEIRQASDECTDWKAGAAILIGKSEVPFMPIRKVRSCDVYIDLSRSRRCNVYFIEEEPGFPQLYSILDARLQGSGNAHIEIDQRFLVLRRVDQSRNHGPKAPPLHSRPDFREQYHANRLNDVIPVSDWKEGERANADARHEQLPEPSYSSTFAGF